MRRDAIDTGHPLRIHAVPRRHDAQIVSVEDDDGLRIRYEDDDRFDDAGIEPGNVDQTEDVQGRQPAPTPLDSQLCGIRETGREDGRGVY